MQLENLLKKYDAIIKEEINVKDITQLDSSVKFTKVFKPIGSKLSAKFGKDTGKVIQYGKQGNIKAGEHGSMIVFDDNNNEWILEAGEYEIAYEGLSGDNIAIDNEIIARLDFTMTPELIKEGIAREISRFLNQMRKEANYNVADRVHLSYQAEDKDMIEVMTEFAPFFEEEALVTKISHVSTKPAGDIVADFTSDERVIIFSLKK